MYDVFLKVLNMSLAAIPLILLVIVLRLALKRAPRWTVLLLWGVVALRLVLPFSIESVLSLIPSAEPIDAGAVQFYTPGGTYRAPVIDTGIPAVNEAVAPIIDSIAGPANPGTSVNPLYVAANIASVLWIIGLAAMLAWAAASWMSLRSRVSTAVQLTDGVWQSEGASGPFVLGVFRPKIYVPYTLQEPELGYVLSHERAHIARRDTWLKPLAYLILTLHWFNPLAWCAWLLFCRDIELACDERVVKTLDAAGRADYSEALLRCASRGRRAAACPLAFGESGVKRRINSVLNYKKPAFWVVIACVILCAALAVCFLTNPVENEGVGAEDISYSFEPESGEAELELILGHIAGEVNTAAASAGAEASSVELEALTLMARDIDCAGAGGEGHLVNVYNAPYHYELGGERVTGGYDSMLAVYSDESGGFVGVLDGREVMEKYSGNLVAAVAALLGGGGGDAAPGLLMSIEDLDSPLPPLYDIPEAAAEEIVAALEGDGEPHSGRSRYLVSAYYANGGVYDTTKSYIVNSENPLCERLGELFSERRVIERSGADIEQAFAAVREYCAGKGISIERLWYDRDASSMDVLEYVFQCRLGGTDADAENYLVLYFNGEAPGLGSVSNGVFTLARTAPGADWSAGFAGESGWYTGRLENPGNVVQVDGESLPAAEFADGVGSVLPPEVRDMALLQASMEADAYGASGAVINSVTAHEAAPGRFNSGGEDFSLVFYALDTGFSGDYADPGLGGTCLLYKLAGGQYEFIATAAYSEISGMYDSSVYPDEYTSAAVQLYARYFADAHAFGLEDVTIDAGANSASPEPVIERCAALAAEAANSYQYFGALGGVDGPFEILDARIDSIELIPADAAGAGGELNWYVPHFSFGIEPGGDYALAGAAEVEDGRLHDGGGPWLLCMGGGDGCAIIGELTASDIESLYSGPDGAAAALYAAYSAMSAGDGYADIHHGTGAAIQADLTAEEISMLWDWYVSGSDGGGGNFEQAYIVEFRAPGASAMPMTWEVYPGSGHYSQLAALYGGWRAVERSEADIRSAFEAVREHCAGTGTTLTRLWYDRNASSSEVILESRLASLNGVEIAEQDLMILYFNGSLPGSQAQGEYMQFYLTREGSASPWSVRYNGYARPYVMESSAEGNLIIDSEI